MRRMIFFSLLVIAWWGAVLSPQSPAPAQEKSVVVERRDAQITILPSGDVELLETWEVRFIGGPFTQAFRAIPLNKVTAIQAWSVSENGQAYRQAPGARPGTFTVTQEEGAVTARWHFPPTSDQTRTFLLGYTLRGALRIYPAGDQFYWKFIESDRGYPIQSASVALRLPAEAAPADLKLATYLNSSEQPGARILDRRTIQFSGGPFTAGDVWEIRVQFPHGLVTALPPAWQLAEPSAALVTALNVLGVLLAGLGVLTGGALLLRYRRRNPVEIREPVYAPPAPLPPAVAGALTLGSINEMHLVATLVDLARRGCLRITGGEEDLKLTRLQPLHADLQPYEARLLEVVFSEEHELDKPALVQRLKAAAGGFRRGVNRELARLGYRLPVHPTVILLPISLTLFLPVTMLISILSDGQSNLGLVASMVAGFILFPVSFFLENTTASGVEAAARWSKFEDYLASDLASRQAESTSFEAWLPYAIAFNIERMWVDAFETRQAPGDGWLASAWLAGSDSWDAAASGRPGSAAPAIAGVSPSLAAISAQLYHLVDTLAFETQDFFPSAGGGGGSDGGWSDGGGGGGSGGDGGGGGSSGFG